MSKPNGARAIQREAFFEGSVRGVLREIGFEQDEAVRAWAAYWLALDEDDAGRAAATRALAHAVEADRWPLSTVAEVHGRLTATAQEQGARHARDQARAGSSRAKPEALGARHGRHHDHLVTLLATVEGLRVLGSLDGAPDAASPNHVESDRGTRATTAVVETLRKLVAETVMLNAAVADLNEARATSVETERASAQAAVLRALARDMAQRILDAARQVEALHLGAARSAA